MARSGSPNTPPGREGVPWVWLAAVQIPGVQAVAERTSSTEGGGWAWTTARPVGTRFRSVTGTSNSSGPPSCCVCLDPQDFPTKALRLTFLALDSPDVLCRNVSRCRLPPAR